MVNPQDNSQSHIPPITDSSLYRKKLIRPLAKLLAPGLVKMGFSANGVCWLKLIVGLGGALLLVSISPVVCFLGMLLLQINFLLDAVDGEVARIRLNAANLSGEYLDKLCDHLPKTAMYFLWGYGAFRLTHSHIPLLCGAFLSAWNIFPRFCGVETLLERIDKAPQILQNPLFPSALAQSFVTKRERGQADFFLTVLIHPAMNLLTIFFLFEILLPEVKIGSYLINIRQIFLILYSAISLVNFLRKGIRYFKILNFG
jgi:hypothetical protein